MSATKRAAADALRPTLPSRSASPSTRPTRGTPQETRRRLVSAAGVVFNRDGFDGTDTNRIARAAGYSPGTFYKHFHDKTAVFVAVYDEWVAEEWRGIEAILAGTRAGGDPSAGLVASVLALHERWRGFRRSLRRLTAHDAGVRRAYVRARARQLAAMARLGGGRRDRERHAVLLYTLERTADALADGEAEDLGLDRAAMTRLLEVRVRELRRGGEVA